eukprot:TRINITY_DN7964_c0_g1_i2.p1 TRINITY_DN7964_c0_g1~~TRINITY_DN7964_c0_g1_i2.p1  ORF type:complete len:149 (+),score=8.23 TRINITY_DN7964_c0_g1_i2:47-493(+)
MQRIIDKKTPTRLGVWICGCICCALPLGVAGIVVAAQQKNCNSFWKAWVILQSLFVLLQPFSTFPFYLSPNRKTKLCFMGTSVIALIVQVAWMITGTITIAGHYGQDCKRLGKPLWAVGLALIIFGYLGLCQSIGVIVDTASVEVDDK